MRYTDDPYEDFKRYDREQHRHLAGLPECIECGEPIQDDQAYYINGEWVCEACVETYRREVTRG